MTQAADLMRSNRRVLALPGGAHDRLVHMLAKVLPGGVGVILAIMIVSPMFPRGEVSFLLDRNKVAVTQERIRLEHAEYRGEDNRGRSFSVTAGNAVQRSARVPVVEMQNLSARMDMQDGPAQLSAPQGFFHYDTNRIDIRGPVEFSASGGYRFSTSNITIDLRASHASGTGGVSGAVPSGTFSADQIDVDLAERTVSLTGGAHLQMQPGQ